MYMQMSTNTKQVQINTKQIKLNLKKYISGNLSVLIICLGSSINLNHVIKMYQNLADHCRRKGMSNFSVTLSIKTGHEDSHCRLAFSDQKIWFVCFRDLHVQLLNSNCFRIALRKKFCSAVNCNFPVIGIFMQQFKVQFSTGDLDLWVTCITYPCIIFQYM